MSQNFVALPIYNPTDETVKVNISNIIDIRVIDIGPRQGQEENWYVQVTMLMGKYYLLRLEGAPYGTKAEALTARDSFIDSFTPED